MSITFSPVAQKKFEEIIARYPCREAALLPALWLAQEEFRQLTPEVLSYVAGLLAISPVKAYSVASFYSMYRKAPTGRFHLQVCRNLSCSLLGAEHLISFLEKKLKIKCGETTPDGLFTLSAVECLGSCDTAPVMMINDTYHENLNEPTVEALLATLEKRAP